MIYVVFFFNFKTFLVHYYNYAQNSWSSIFYPWTRFSSEYGLQSLPAYQTLQKVFDDNDLLDFPSPVLVHRQHLQAGYAYMLYQIEANLPVPSNPTIIDYVYLSQVSMRNYVFFLLKKKFIKKVTTNHLF